MENKIQLKISLPDSSINFLSSSLLSFIVQLSAFKLERTGGNNYEVVTGIKNLHEPIMDEIPCVYCKGVQYYDFKNVSYISNVKLVKLINLIKLLTKKGMDVQFVNVNDKIKNKIKSLKLEHIINWK